MITIPYHIFTNGNAAGAMQTLQAVADGFITGFTMACQVQALAAADTQHNWEYSFISGGTGFNTDSRAIIAKLMCGLAFTAALEGSIDCSVLAVTNVRIPWATGERLYVNLGMLVTGGTSYCTGIIYQEVEDRAFSRPGMRLT